MHIFIFKSGGDLFLSIFNLYVLVGAIRDWLLKRYHFLSLYFIHPVRGHVTVVNVTTVAIVFMVWYVVIRSVINL